MIGLILYKIIITVIFIIIIVLAISKTKNFNIKLLIILTAIIVTFFSATMCYRKMINFICHNKNH